MVVVEVPPEVATVEVAPPVVVILKLMVELVEPLKLISAALRHVLPTVMVPVALVTVIHPDGVRFPIVHTVELPIKIDPLEGVPVMPVPPTDVGKVFKFHALPVKYKVPVVLAGNALLFNPVTVIASVIEVVPLEVPVASPDIVKVIFWLPDMHVTVSVMVPVEFDEVTQFCPVKEVTPVLVVVVLPPALATDTPDPAVKVWAALVLPFIEVIAAVR